MKIKCVESFGVSLDGGSTVTTFEPGEHDVPDIVGQMAMKHYKAEEIKPEKPKKNKDTE